MSVYAPQMYATPPPAVHQAQPGSAESIFMQKCTQENSPDASENAAALQQVDNLKYFLISAPVDWDPSQSVRKFALPTGEYVNCIFWNNLFHITGTDIVRVLSFRFQAFGRPVKNTKKFEEGVFSDLRNLKAGTDATLEEPKSPFLDFLYKHNCIRTQKKQKVFYWYSVPHDRLFLDALERDLKRQRLGQTPTTVAVSEPALSFQYDSSRSLFEQLSKTQQGASTVFGNPTFQPAATYFPPQPPVFSQYAYMPTPLSEIDPVYNQPSMQASMVGMVNIHSVEQSPVPHDMGIVTPSDGLPAPYEPQIGVVSPQQMAELQQYAHYSSVEPEYSPQQYEYQVNPRDGSVVSIYSWQEFPEPTLISPESFELS